LQQLQLLLHGREQLGMFCKAAAQGVEGSLLQLPGPRLRDVSSDVNWMPQNCTNLTKLPSAEVW